MSHHNPTGLSDCLYDVCHIFLRRGEQAGEGEFQQSGDAVGVLTEEETRVPARAGALAAADEGVRPGFLKGIRIKV
jgi:hypothetical protein